MIVHSVAEFGAAVRKQRKLLKLTQTQVAEICNTGVRFIVDLENGKETIQMGKAMKIAKALGIETRVDIYDFLE